MLSGVYALPNISNGNNHKINNNKQVAGLKNSLANLILNTQNTPTKTLLNTYFSFLGISKRSLAKELDISHTLVNKAISGELPSGETTAKIFNAIGIENPYQ